MGEKPEDRGRDSKKIAQENISESVNKRDSIEQVKATGARENKSGEL